MPSAVLAAIQSVRFPNAFLRMGVSNLPGPPLFSSNFAGGIGTVNCQFYSAGQLPVPSIGNWEVFELIPIPEIPNNGWAIRSFNFPEFFLRIDGSNVTQFQGGGSGIVNCQYYGPGAYPSLNDYESLLIFTPTQFAPPNSESPIMCTIQGNFPGVYLRMDGSGTDESQSNGSGIVNCQYYDPSGPGPQSTSDYELFQINILSSYRGPF